VFDDRRLPVGLGVGYALGVAVRAHDPNVLAATRGYIVADARGRIVGRVDEVSVPQDAAPRLTVRARLPWRRPRIVTISEIDAVDPGNEVIALSVEREHLRQP
jgi:hypothetical protein